MHFKKYRSILSPQNGINIYRGCSHGCIYCDSRSRCYRMDHDFEDIEVKTDAPLQLEAALKKKRKKCMIGTGSMCDPYMHCEETLGYTRKCLEIIEKYGFGVSIQTKSNRIFRDLDLLKAINKNTKCVVQMTLTTFDEDLCSIVEPGVSTTRERFETLMILRENDIRTVVWICPILPYINDNMENIAGLLHYCKEAEVFGIICFGMAMTLREGNREYYYGKLNEYFPGLARIYQYKYGDSYEIRSDNDAFLMKYLNSECSQYDIISDNNKIFNFLHTFDEKMIPEQISLF